MYYLVFFALLIMLIIIIRIFNNRRKKIMNREVINNQWGKMKNENFNFHFIEDYSRRNTGSFFYELSDQTINDIDFFDIFCFIDRTTSRPGQQFLFDRLKKSTSDITALERLDTRVNFFTENPETRIGVQEMLIKLNDPDSYFITSLLQENLARKSKWPGLLAMDSFIVAILIILIPFLPVVLFWLLPIFAVNLFVHFKNKNNTYQYIKSFPQLSLLINITDRLCKEKIPFDKSEVLKSIASLKEFQKKFRLLSFGQSKGDDLTQVFWLFIELIKALFLIEVHTFRSLIRILDTKQKEVFTIFNFIGEIDSCISIASLRAGSEKTCTPVFHDKEKTLIAMDVYHPLIINCVPNTISICGKSVLITGSNMSGKTTFLRTIGVNSLLAQSIYTCFATRFETPVMKVFSSIRIDDDLLEGKSYYLEEVETMSTLIREAPSSVQNLFLLDEVFKGTNTVERIAAAKAILSYLNRHNNIVIVSTHDLELSEMLKNEYDLYHFEDTIHDRQLNFDHLLKQGPLKTRNAIFILEVSNYPKEITDEATMISKNIHIGNLDLSTGEIKNKNRRR